MARTIHAPELMQTHEGSVSDISSPAPSRTSSSVDSPGTVHNSMETHMSPISLMAESSFSFGPDMSTQQEILFSPLVDEHPFGFTDGGELSGSIIIKPEEESPGRSTGTLPDLGESPAAPASPRRRGRPRKGQVESKALPTIDEKVEVKKTKGRTKTGCFTCRERKKKCDEGKPVCAGCLKNGVICKGYPEVQQWKSGKEKNAMKLKMQKWKDAGPLVLPSTFPCIQDDLDSRLFSHIGLFTSILSLDKEKTNPFQEILIPMAVTHEGLMHMLLSVAGSHIRQVHPSTLNETLTSRIEFHYQNGHRSLIEAPSSSTTILDGPLLAIATLNCLQNIVDGSTKTNWFNDLQMIIHGMDSRAKSEEKLDKTLTGFLAEFVIYHKTASMITQRQPFEFNFYNLDGFLNATDSAFLGVCNTIIPTIAKTRGIRDRIRDLQTNHEEPSNHQLTKPLLLRGCDGENQNDFSHGAQDLDHDGDTTMEFTDSRRRASLGPQYRSSLSTGRSFKFPKVDYEAIKQAVEVDKYLSNCTCKHPLGSELWVCWQVYRVAAWLYMYRTVYNSAPSPALDKTFELAFKCLYDIPDHSSCQSVLLTPVFMMGCSAFKPEHREGVLTALETIENYSHLGNIRHARAIVTRVWELMDSESESERQRSWDWEGVMEEMGFDLLIT